MSEAEPSPEAMRWALQRIADATNLPAERRGDLGFLRHTVVLARGYARAGLLGKMEVTPPVLEGQLELTFEEADAHETRGPSP